MLACGYAGCAGQERCRVSDKRQSISTHWLASFNGRGLCGRLRVCLFQPYETSSPRLRYQSLNPSNSVPTLVVESASADKNVIGQSRAALEWLCETQQSSVALMPINHLVRARVRELCMIIMADAQPLTSSRVKSRIAEMGRRRGRMETILVWQSTKCLQRSYEEWARRSPARRVFCG